jgi:hypothetical protein
VQEVTPTRQQKLKEKMKSKQNQILKLVPSTKYEKDRVGAILAYVKLKKEVHHLLGVKRKRYKLDMKQI